MATWYAHALTTFDPETGLFSEDMKGLVENFPAMAEGADNAYYLQSAWHPYNGSKVADGFTGLIYDFAVTGAAASVVTPNFVDRYEYRLRFEGVVGPALAGSLGLELYQEAAASYTARANITSAVQSAENWGSIQIERPRITSVFFLAPAAITNNVAATNGTSVSGVGYQVASTKILRARVTPTSGNITAGRIYMDKRRAY